MITTLAHKLQQRTSTTAVIQREQPSRLRRLCRWWWNMLLRTSWRGWDNFSIWLFCACICTSSSPNRPTN